MTYNSRAHMVPGRIPGIMVQPPPAQGGLMRQHQHPRRSQAHRSVSLLHSPTLHVLPNDRSDTSSASRSPLRHTSTDSPPTLRPQGRNSSGEGSNADKWFDKSNNDVHGSTYTDNEPPYLMRNNSSSSDTPPAGRPELLRRVTNADSNGSLPFRTAQFDLGDDDSNTEDFRSVIDDLTIENKKLKRRLKRYEKLHDAHLKDEKLFEVRIHGLPAVKKRELEETLRKFAASLGTKSGPQFPVNGYQDLLPLLNNRKQRTGSSQASLNNTDSAYASMSASGKGGSSHRSASVNRRNENAPMLASRQQNIQSFLHQIPEGLIPQPNPVTMTENAKKKLVVRRLEQLFAGKGAGELGLHHSQQQQEVSQNAARADRSAMEAQGERARREGIREAKIMREDAESAKQSSPNAAGRAGQAQCSTEDRDFAVSPNPAAAFEQRPTRPLDVDPHRAQVPADNIRYMRHLGFSPPDPRSSRSPEEGHGWIYLNLLISMAQLHTINVTADFVCKALGEHSEKFEIAPDGRKVRWRGGRNMTSSGAVSVGRTIEDIVDVQSPRKRQKLSHDANSRPRVHAQTGVTQRSQTERNKLVYTPMFFHKECSDSGDDSSSEEGEDETTSHLPGHIGGDSSAVTSSRVRATKNKKSNDGPIIFYNNARFCTDLSGEHQPQENLNCPPYTKMSVHPIGRPLPASRTLDNTRGPLARASDLPEPMDLGDNPIPDSMELTFPLASPLAPGSAGHKAPFNFEVTGIGGVWPADNFAINVESRHARVDHTAAPEVSSKPFPVSLPSRLAHVLNSPSAKTKSRGAIHKQIFTSKHRELPPSELPPALCFMPVGEGSMGDDDSSLGDTKSSASPDIPGALPPAAAPQPLDVHFAGSDEEDEDDDDEYDDDSSDVESDCSLDLLAAAREIDPEAIRAREREYDAHMAERLANEIPAGSSAATAGGGSGFPSPASRMGRGGHRRAFSGVHVVHPPNLSRTETVNSMHVEGEDESEGSGDEDDEEM